MDCKAGPEMVRETRGRQEGDKREGGKGTGDADLPHPGGLSVTNFCLIAGLCH